MATTAERIKEALRLRNMRQSELVEKTGIGKSSISTYISGAYVPKQRNIYKIAKALSVSEAWLMGLDVPMERPEQQTFFDVMGDDFCLDFAIDNDNYVLKQYLTTIYQLRSNHDEILLDLYNNPDTKDQLMDFARALRLLDLDRNGKIQITD